MNSEQIFLSNPIEVPSFMELILSRGFNFFTSVPCSIQRDLIDEIIATNNDSYVPASNEGDAIAIASGAWLVGKKCLVICQNTGLADMLGPLVSITKRFQIPLLVFISLRENNKDNGTGIFPWANLTTPILDLINIPYCIISQNSTLEEIRINFEEAEKFLNKRIPFVFLIKKGIFDQVQKTYHSNCRIVNKVYKSIKIDYQNLENPTTLTRYEVLSFLRSHYDSNTLYVANEGYTSRELFFVGDTSSNFYLSPLGYITSISLGSAMNTSRKLIALDGDGSILMQLGNLATISLMQPKNLIHIVFDNGVYESTGSQISPALSIDLDNIALSFGYHYVMMCNDLEGLKKLCQITVQHTGPHFIHVKIKPGTSTVEPVKLHTEYIAQRFRDHLLTTQ